MNESTLTTNVTETPTRATKTASATSVRRSDIPKTVEKGTVDMVPSNNLHQSLSYSKLVRSPADCAFEPRHLTPR